MSTAFVTGGTGFVGINLITLLRERGWDVVAVHRSTSRVDVLRDLGARLVVADVTDGDAILAAMPEGVDAVFHTAGNTSTWSGDKSAQTRTNVEGTRSVVRAALARKAGRFVHTSSIATYGSRAYSQRIAEESPSDAATHWVNYIRTKWAGEQIVREAMKDGLDAVILNPANIIGPHDLHNWSRLFSLVASGKLPGVPPGMGSWCDVGEVVRAHVAAAELGRTGQNYLLGGIDARYHDVTSLVAELTGAKAPPAIPAVALRSLARVNEWVSRFTGKEPDITPEGAYLVCGDGVVNSSKAERELGFQERPLREMVDGTLQWMRSAGLLKGPHA